MPNTTLSSDDEIVFGSSRLRYAVAIVAAATLIVGGASAGPKAMRAFHRPPAPKSAPAQPPTPPNTTAPTPSPSPSPSESPRREPTFVRVDPLTKKTGARIVLTTDDSKTLMLADVDHHSIAKISLPLAKDESIYTVIAVDGGIGVLTGSWKSARVLFVGISPDGNPGAARRLLRTGGVNAVWLFGSHERGRMWFRVQGYKEDECGECTSEPTGPGKMWEINTRGLRTSAIFSYDGTRLFPTIDTGESFVSASPLMEGGGVQTVEILNRSTLHVTRRVLTENDGVGRLIGLSSRFVVTREDVCDPDGYCADAESARLIDIATKRTIRIRIPSFLQQTGSPAAAAPDGKTFAIGVAASADEGTGLVTEGYVLAIDAATGFTQRIPDSENTYLEEAQTKVIGYSASGAWFFYVTPLGELRAFEGGTTASFRTGITVPSSSAWAPALVLGG